MNKRAKVAVLALAAVIAEAYANPQDSEDHKANHIVGRWDCLIRLADGSGQVLQFASDGSFTEVWDYERQDSYKLKGSQLTIRTWSGGKEKKRLFEITQEGRQLILRESEGEEIRLTPVCKGDNAGAGVVREWFSENFPGAIHVLPLTVPPRFPAFVEFLKDGSVYFRSVPTKSTNGSYDFAEKRLTLTREGRAPVKLNPSISPKRLDIRIFGEKTHEIPYRRIEGSECGRFDATAR